MHRLTTRAFGIVTGSALAFVLLPIVAHNALANPPAGREARKPLPRETTLRVHLLPDTAAADGNLSEWAGVPASATPEHFKFIDRDERITPDPAEFAPALYLGRRKDSPDLHVLVVVRDDRISAQDNGSWAYGDYLDLFVDFGREKRAKQDPKWFADDKQYHQAKEAHFWGCLPRGLEHAPKQYPGWPPRNFKADYQSTPIEGGGVAYELRIDGKTVLDDLKLDALPKEIGIDVGISDADEPVILEGAGWNNRDGVFRLFGDGSASGRPHRHGGVNTEPAAPPPGASELPAVTLASLYGDKPSAQDVAGQIGKLPTEKLADLVYWAGCGGVALDPKTVEALMAVDAPRVRENTLAAVWAVRRNQDKADPAVGRAVELAYALPPGGITPQGLVHANRLNAKFGLGHADRLLPMLKDPNLTVAITAARALSRVGTADEATKLKSSLDALLADKTREKQHAAVRLFIEQPLDDLRFRTGVLKAAAATPLRQVQNRNTDLHRLMPIDGNNVYDGANLLGPGRKTPPRQLWKKKVGAGNSGVVEAGGRALLLADDDFAQVALCLDAKTGKKLWDQLLKDGESNYAGVTPVLDGAGDDARAYFVPESGGVFCLRATDGKVLWKETAVHGGHFAVPLVVGDTLYLPSTGPALVALDKHTGKVKWKLSEPGGTSPASPAYHVAAGRTLITLGVGGGPGAAVWGVDADAGKVLWKYPVRNDFGLCSSPVVDGSRLLLSSGKAQQEFFTRLQLVSEPETGSAPKAVHVYTTDKTQGNWANTIAVYDGCAFGFSNVEGGAIECTDVETGSVRWREKGNGWSYDAQLICADGLLFALNKKNELVVLEASPAAYKELHRVKVDTPPGQQQPTIANGRLYVRGQTSVVCLDVSGDNPAESPAAAAAAAAAETTTGSPGAER